MAARWSDERIDALVSRVLRAGVLLAAMIVAAGGVLYVAKYGGGTPAYGAFRGEPDDLRNVRGIIAAAVALRPRGLIQLGLITLVLTPVARVALLAITFVLQRDRLYTAISLLVLVALVLSLAGVIV